MTPELLGAVIVGMIVGGVTAIGHFLIYRRLGRVEHKVDGHAERIAFLEGVRRAGGLREATEHA